MPLQTQAAFNPEINYQGKLIDTGTGDPVATDDYNFEFKLYDAPSGGNLVWTETRTGGNQVTVTDGLFSVMLGNVNSLASVNFNQALYLTVNVGGTGAPAWDGEMTPRKRLGAVTAAFEADRLDGLTSSDFLSTSTFSAPSIGSVGSSSATTTAAGNFVVSGATRLASSLSGILKATAGYVTTALVDLANDVTGILGIDNGGTGIATTPSYGQLLVGNGSGYTLTATSSLGVAISDTTGTLAVARGGTNATAQTTNGVSYFNGTAITSGSSLVFNGTNLGVGTSTPSYTLSVEGTVGFQGNNFATTTIGNFTSNVTIGAIDSFIGKIPFIRSLAEDGTALLVNKGAFYVQEDLTTNALPTVGFISDDLSSSATITYATTTGALAISSTATTTSNVGFDISSGCYAINGTCITASGSSQWTTSGDDVFYINSNGGGVGVLNDFMPTFILGKANASDFAGFTWSSSTDRLSFTGAIGGYGFDGPIINSSSTATSTFAGDIQIASGKNLQVSNIFAYSPLNISTNLNVTGAGTSTFANGIALTTGCITVGGVCVGGHATTSVDYWLTTKTTDNLTQGATNLYWSNTLFDNRLSASSSIAGITTLSNLTSVGTITSGTWSATEIGISKGGTNATSQTTNGVTYYDGTSITSGTTLVFNGTNLGVGSSTPGFKLSVAGDAWFDDGGGTTNIWAEQSEIIRNDGVTNYFGNVSGVSLPVVIRAGGADRMYIDNSTGFVGIGTSSPTQLLELRTSGALGPVIKLDAAESGAGAWALVAKASGNLATGGFGIYDFDALAYRLNITADGYVGVGTTTPLDKLVVENTGNANNYRMLRLQNYSTGNAAVSGMEINAGANANGALLYMRGSGYSTDPNSFWINNVTAAPIVLATNNSERLRVTSVGSVGINNTAPYSMLDVATTTNVTGQTNVLTIRNNSITASTEAGIFFSPSTAVGNIRGATISGVQEDGSNSIGLRLRTSVGGVFNEAVTVRSSGYIGIGTTTPNRHLTVWKSGIRGEILLADGSATVDTSTQGGTYLSSDQGLFNIQGMNSQGSGTGSFFTVDQVNARVGVGTTAPEGSLEVQAAEATAASLYLDADDGDDVADTWILQALTTNNFTLTNGATEVFALTTGGNLQIDGTIDVGSFAASDDNSRWVCIDAAGNSTLQAGVNAASGDCDTSSVTVKHDINDLSINGLDTLRTLRPVSFIYNSDVTNTITWGFVAEEVDAIDQALAGHNTDGAPRSIQKNAIMAVLTKAMQELTIEVDVLKSNASSPAPLAVSGGGTGSFNHLTVTQTATFYGMITVHGQANFMSKVVFSEDVEIEGHLTLGNDTSGTATIEKDEDSIEVIFDEPYLMAPRIILTPQGPLGGREYWVSDKSETGFTIKIDGQVDEDFDFDWLAIAPWGTTDEPVVIDQPDTNATDTTEPESDVSEPVTETTVVNPDSDEPIVTETTVVNPDSSEEVSSADEPIVTESTEPTTVVNPDSSEEVSSTDAPIATESSQPSTTE